MKFPNSISGRITAVFIHSLYTIFPASFRVIGGYEFQVYIATYPSPRKDGPAYALFFICLFRCYYVVFLEKVNAVALQSDEPLT